MEQIALMSETEKDRPAQTGTIDRRAFQTLFEENHRQVFSVALNFFGGKQEPAEDVTQQVFLKACRKLESFRGDSGIKTWLYRITINTCIDEEKKTRRFSFLGDMFGLFESETNRTEYESIYQKEISGEVREAVAALKPKFRLPILLKYVEGLSYREMAEILECSEGTIASRLNRGHKMLARKLDHLKDGFG